MTKQELLDQLAGFSWVNHLVGEPIQDTVQADGSIVYIQNLLDIAIETGIYRDVQFYVCDEGQPEELAVYKDKIPTSQVANESEVQSYEVTQWLLANPKPELKAFRVEQSDPVMKNGLIKAFSPDVDNPGAVIYVGYLYEWSGTDVTLLKIDVLPSELSSLF
jgi:hypothetical protein